MKVAGLFSEGSSLLLWNRVSLIVCGFLVSFSLFAQVDSDVLLSLPFDGNFVDVANTPNSFSEYGVITYGEDRHGNSNSAASFTGSQFLDVTSESNFHNLPAYTVSFFCKPTEESGAHVIINKVTPGRDYVIEYTNGKFNNNHTESGVSGLKFVGSPSVSVVDVWYHVAYVFDGVEVKFYVDGVLVNSRVVQGAPGGTGGNMSIGAFNSSNSLPYKGLLDDLIIRGRALTEQEIQDEMLSGGEPCEGDVTINHTSSKCQGESMSFWNSGYGFTIYKWYVNGVLAGTDPNFTHVMDQPFEIKLVGENSMCSLDDTKQINVILTDFDLIGVLDVCKGSDGNAYTIEPANNESVYNWSFEGAPSSITPSTGPAVSIEFGNYISAGEKIVVQYTSQEGCSGTKRFDVELATDCSEGLDYPEIVGPEFVCNDGELFHFEIVGDIAVSNTYSNGASITRAGTDMEVTFPQWGAPFTITAQGMFAGEQVAINKTVQVDCERSFLSSVVFGTPSENPSASYYPEKNNAVFFEFKDSHHPDLETLDFKVFNFRRQELTTQVELSKVGINLYKLNVLGLQLDNSNELFNYYTLEVFDTAGNKFQMRFRIQD